MKIKFQRDASYPQNDAANSRQYRAGEVYDLDDDHAQRWIRRGAAVEVVKESKKAKVVEDAAPAIALVPNPPVKG